MKMPRTPFSTRLSGSAKETELRLRSIFQWEKKRPPAVVVLLAVLAVVFCGGLVVFVPDYEQIPDGADVLAALELSDSLVYAEGPGNSHFDLVWVKEGQEPKLLCRLGYWGKSDVQLKKVQLGQQNYLLVQYESHYPDAFFWNYKKFTNFFYLPEDGAPLYTLQIEGDFYFKDLSGDGADEIVHYKDYSKRIAGIGYRATSDGRLLKADARGNLIDDDDEISQNILERLCEGNFFTGVDYAPHLVRRYEGIEFYIFEDSLSVLTH